MEVLEHDVLVIGGGAAGLRAAIATAEAAGDLRIALISKVYPVRSHTVAAEGGAAAVLREYDNPDLHMHDTIRGADYLADQDAVESFVREAPAELIRLEHWGCPWSRDAEGRMATRPFGGMSVPRTFFAADKTGFHLLHTLFQTSLKYPQIVRYDEWFVTSLLMLDGRVRGAVCLELSTGVMRAVIAKAIIMATGGGGRIYPFTTNGAISTGDGMALAYRAGVPLKDMEFIQYHPTGLPHQGILITEAARGEGGYLLNRLSERFLERYVPSRMELGPRDLISRAIVTELEEGRGFGGPESGYVHLDVRHLGERKLEERLPFVLELARTYAKIDPVRQPIPVRPVVHYMMGGIHTDINGRTPLEGLYACGETACVSINGANRLGSNSLSECLVFGARAGKAAGEYAREQAHPSARALAARGDDEASRIEGRFLQASGEERVAELRHEMQQAMETGAGVFRNEEDLRRAADKLSEIRERASRLRLGGTTVPFNVELTAALEFDFMLDLASVIVQCALARKESRGAHARRDYPQRNDRDYLAHSLAHFSPDGPRLEPLPVVITRWQPTTRKY